MTDIEQQAADATARVNEWINRSAGQHKRAMNAPIFETQAEAEYAKPLHGYTDLDQRNSDGTDPHAETRDIVDLVLDFALVLLALAGLTFTLFSLLGFFFGGKS